MKNICHIITIMFALKLSSVFAETEIIKRNINGYVTDLAGLLSSEEEEKLNNKIVDFKNKSSVEIAIVTVQDMGGEDIEGYANKLFNSWGIGKSGLDNGLLILVSMKEKRWRIEVGRGLEGDITDLRSYIFGEEILKPSLKNKNYYAGFNNLLDAFWTKIDPIKKEQMSAYKLQQEKENEESFNSFFEGLIYVILFLIILSLIFYLVNIKKKNKTEKKEEFIDYKTLDKERIKTILSNIQSIKSEFINNKWHLNRIKNNTYGIEIDDLIKDFENKYKILEILSAAAFAINVHKISNQEESLLIKIWNEIETIPYELNIKIKNVKELYEKCKKIEETYDLIKKIKSENEKSIEVFYEKTKIINLELSKSKTFKKTINEDEDKKMFYLYINQSKKIIEASKQLLYAKDVKGALREYDKAIINYNEANKLKNNFSSFCSNYDNMKLSLKTKISELEGNIKRTKFKINDSDVSYYTKTKFRNKEKECNDFLLKQGTYDLFTFSALLDENIDSIRKIYRKAENEIEEEESSRRRQRSNSYSSSYSGYDVSSSSFDYSSSSSSSFDFGGGDSGGGGSSGSFD